MKIRWAAFEPGLQARLEPADVALDALGVICINLVGAAELHPWSVRAFDIPTPH